MGKKKKARGYVTCCRSVRIRIHTHGGRPPPATHHRQPKDMAQVSHAPLSVPQVRYGQICMGLGMVRLYDNTIPYNVIHNAIHIMSYNTIHYIHTCSIGMDWLTGWYGYGRRASEPANGRWSIRRMKVETRRDLQDLVRRRGPRSPERGPRSCCSFVVQFNATSDCSNR